MPPTSYLLKLHIHSISAQELCPFGYGEVRKGFLAHRKQSTIYPMENVSTHGLGTIPVFAAAKPENYMPIIPAPESPAIYSEALAKLDVASVQKDLVTLMSKSQAWWPADSGNYGPFFIRLAWHCSGAYRYNIGNSAPHHNSHFNVINDHRLPEPLMARAAVPVGASGLILSGHGRITRTLTRHGGCWHPSKKNMGW